MVGTDQGMIDSFFCVIKSLLIKFRLVIYLPQFKNRAYTLLIPIFRFFIQPMSSKLFVSKERNSR